MFRLGTIPLSVFGAVRPLWLMSSMKMDAVREAVWAKGTASFDEAVTLDSLRVSVMGVVINARPVRMVASIVFYWGPKIRITDGSYNI
jgi:hypothetical protein